MSLFDKAIDPSIVAASTPVAAMAPAPVPIAQFEDAPKKKREAPEAWANTGITIAGADHYFQRKFFRIEKEQKLDAWILQKYEEKYNEHMAVEGNTPQNFPKFRVVTFMDIVPANGATSQEIIGEIQLMEVTQ